MYLIRIVLMVIGAVATLAVAGVVAVLLFYSTRTLPVPDRTVLALDLSRPIPELGSGGFTPWYGLPREQPDLWQTVAAIERAARDDRVVGLMARVGASGMGLARVQELRDAIRTFRRSGKPTYAFAESFGDFGPGNGAFYLAAAFEKIYLQPSGSVGLTGLLVRNYFLKNALEKLDVQFRMNQRGEYKGIRERFENTRLSAPGREAFTRILESLTEQLTAGIAEGRGISRETLDVLMRRAPLTADEALDEALVDGLLYRDEVRARVRKSLGSDVRFLTLSRYRSRLEAGEGDPTTVALIYGLGNIHGGRSRHRGFAGAQSMGSDSLARALRAAARDNQVRAIIFRIDSPGGSYVASDVIRRGVHRARRRGKPVIVSMGDVAGSGGYFIAASADRIVAQPATITGSIGVAAGKMVTRGLWNKLGVTWEEIPGNANATFWSPLQDYGPEQRKRLDHLLDVVYEDFVSKVAQGRGLSPEEVRVVAKGRVWSGVDAREHGLVDELGGYAATLRAAREAASLAPDAAIRLRLFPRRKSTLRLFAEAIAEHGKLAAGFPADSLPGRFLEHLGILPYRGRAAGLTERRELLEMPLPERLR